MVLLDNARFSKPFLFGAAVLFGQLLAPAAVAQLSRVTIDESLNQSTRSTAPSFFVNPNASIEIKLECKNYWVQVVAAGAQVDASKFVKVSDVSQEDTVGVDSAIHNDDAVATSIKITRQKNGEFMIPAQTLLVMKKDKKPVPLKIKATKLDKDVSSLTADDNSSITVPNLLEKAQAKLKYSILLRAPASDSTIYIITKNAKADKLTTEDTAPSFSPENTVDKIDLIVAQNGTTSAFALTGFALRANSAPSGYSLTKFGSSTVRIDPTYNDRFDLNFSAGYQFVLGEVEGVSKFSSKVLSFGLSASNPSHYRVGFILGITQPASSGNESLKFGPIVYLTRDMKTAIIYGIEAFQGSHFAKGTYSYGQWLPSSTVIDSSNIVKTWNTGFYIGLVYKI